MHGPPHIADHAVLGNGRTAALVARDGSIDFYCWPRFDSPALLCRLLDEEVGGFLRVAPTGRHSTTRRYVPGTNVLESTFESARGVVRITDLLPLSPRGNAEGVRAHWIVRRVEGLAGSVPIEVTFRPTFDFARERADLHLVPGGVVAHGSSFSAALVATGRFTPQGPAEVMSRFDIAAGDTEFVLLACGSEVGHAGVHVPEGVLATVVDETISGWRAWLSRCSYEGRYRGAVERSALVLKLLVHGPTGGIVAAPTTSLPERPGGVRNWDYRYTWIRDAGLSIRALMRIGYHDEAMRFWRWIQALGPGPLQIMYRVDGDPELHEELLDHLAGHARSRPVRVGNAAFDQRQLDIHGEILDAAEICERTMGMDRDPAFRAMVNRVALAAARTWRLPDRGIWEVRGPEQHFLHSKLMSWVALDRASAIERRLGDDRRSHGYARRAREVRETILTEGVRGGVFTQAFGSTALDASALEVPLSGMLPADDARVVRTVEALRRELAQGPFVRRYVTEDGLPGSEGAFFLCSFWLVDVLAMQGHIEEAQTHFEQLLECANDVGLLSEEIDPSTGELLGNHPQAFSHLALIRSACNLDDALRRWETLRGAAGRPVLAGSPRDRSRRGHGGA